MNGNYSSADLCRILRLNASGLRSCLHAALLPVCRSKRSNHYSFQQLVILRTAKGLHNAGVSMRQIRKVLDSLQQQLGEGELLSSLQIYASGKRVIVWDGRSRWQPDSGQFLLNFETKQLDKPTTLTRRPRGQPSQAETAQAWFERAMRLQEESFEEARRAYQEAGIEHPRRQLSLMEVHDCFSITELVTMEDLFVSEEGGAVRDVLDGFFDAVGGLPCQIDGGLKCFGHPIGASGLRMVYEVYQQLLGRAGERQLRSPSVGLTHNLGGAPFNGVSAVGIFGLYAA